MKRVIRKTLSALPLLIMTLLLFSCVSVTDYSEDSWPEAFRKMAEDTTLRYPFMKWKDIEAGNSVAEISGELTQAWEDKDREVYYSLIREYAFRLNDKHVFVTTDTIDYIERESEGSFGLGMIKLDNGNYIVHYLDRNGSAARAGIEWGDEIIRWNGLKINAAVSAIPSIYMERPAATPESEELEKCRLLVRGPIGTSIEIEYIDSDTGLVRNAELTALEDHRVDESGTRVAHYFEGEIFGSPLQSEIIADGVGYIRIKRFMPSLACLNPYQRFRLALIGLNLKDAESIILDVRGNEGGLDSLIPKIAGHFFRSEEFYEYVSYFNEETGQFEINPKETLRVIPRWPYFGGKVVVLVDSGTLSTAEGLPMIFQNTNRGVVIGQYDTGASFGCGVSRVYKLPDDIYFGFSPGRSLDLTGRIQVDSDGSGNGGIKPDHRVPVNYETVRARFQDGEDVVLKAALDFLE